MATLNHQTQDNRRRSAITAAGASIGNNEDVRQAKKLLLLGQSLERQPARNATQQEMNAIVEELRAMREQIAETYVRKARKFTAVEDQILSILHSSAQSVTTSGFGEPAIEQQMKARLRPMLERNGILMLPLLMGGGKAANPIKVGPSYLPDLSEWISWSHLEAIGLAVSAVYSPAAKIIAIPDAWLHTADLGMPIEETRAHAEAVQHDLGWLRLQHVVVPDVLPHLGSDWVDGVARLIAEARQSAQVDLSFAAEIREQISSLVYSLNTRVLGRSFDELLPVYAAVAGHTDGLAKTVVEEAHDLYRRSESIAFHYVAVNWAIRYLGLVERIVTALSGSPDHLRLSVHAKPGEPRPKLFPTSGYFPALGGLLPMHGVGVRLTAADKVRYGMAFELAARLREWTPVGAPGSGRFLFFETHLSEENA